jgi:hypothetical protein
MTKIRLLPNSYHAHSEIAKGVNFPVTVRGNPCITQSGILIGYDVSEKNLKSVGFDFSLFAENVGKQYFSIAKQECEAV